MTDFAFSVDEHGGRVQIAEKARGLLDRFRRREPINFDTLKASDKAVAIALARLRGLDRDGQHHTFGQDQITLDHWLLSRVDDFSAAALQLPKRLSGFEFHAEMRGNIGSPRFALEWWWEQGGRQVQLNRSGAVVRNGHDTMRRSLTPSNFRGPSMGQHPLLNIGKLWQIFEICLEWRTTKGPDQRASCNG
jgi:hypothetical protein